MQTTDPQADGYYGDDEMTREEIDLSFLDDEDDAAIPPAKA